MFTNHKRLQHILDQKELNLRSRRLLKLLSDFDGKIRYHPGKASILADALSRNEQAKPLRKCFVDKPLAIPLDEIQIDEKLNFIEEPVEIIDQEVKRLKQSRIPIVKVIFTPNLDLSNSGLEEFQQPVFEGYGPKTSKNVSEDTSNEVKESPNVPMIEFVRPKQREKPVRKPVKYAKMYRSQGPRGNQRNWNNQKSQQLGSDFVMYNKACFVCGSFDHVQANYNYHQRERVVSGNNYTRGHPQKEDQGYVDSGCSSYMTGNMSYLSDFKEFDRGYVTFGGGAKGGKITSKGTLKTGKLDFKDVYFVKELQFNLFSVSQMCDKKNSVLFTNTGCFVLSPNFKLADESQVLLKVPRKNNMYSVDMNNIVPRESLTCLVAKATLDESMLWHRRLGHVNFKTINKLVKENLMRGLPSKRFKNDQTCVACLKEKQHKASCKSKIQNSITQPLFMLHMDLFGPTFVSSLMNKKYCLVVTNDYIRFTWVFFLASKDETSGILKSFITEIENLVDNVARTPQQNGADERRNRTLIEAARTMLVDSKLPTTFWAKAVNTACYVQNRVLVVKPHPALRFMRPFMCHVTILNTLDYLGKFDGNSDEGFFVGYSLNSKAFRVYNTRTRKVEENLHIRFLEDKPFIAGDGLKWLFDIDVLTKSMNYVPVVAGTNSNDSVDGLLFDSSLKNASNDKPQPSSDAGKKDDEDVSQESGIDDQERPENSTQDVNIAGPSINTASTNVNTCSLNINIISLTVTTAPLEATHVDFFGDETELDMSNITTTYLTRRMTKTSNEQGFISDVYEGKSHEDLHTCLFACFLSQVEPKNVIQALIDPSWIEAMHDELLQFKLQKGYTQEEGIDYDEVFDLVARIEAIRLFLAYASFKAFVVYQMDVKSAFLKGQIDKTLFIKRVKGDILLVQVYVDDIIFGSTRNEMCTEFEKMMHKKFQMSSMGELTFFLGLQATQKDDGIFISQDKYVDEILKKFSFLTVKTASTPMDTSKALLKDAEAEDVDVHLYRSMIGSLMYLIALRPSIIFAVCAYARFQVTPKVSHLHAMKRIFRYLKGQPKLGLWYPTDSPFDLEDYTDSDYTGACLDRKSTTRVKNPVFHSKTKHIEIRHHFIRDSNEKKLIQMIKIHTHQNVTDLLIKSFDVGRFQYLIASIRMLNL
ncbi:putative ribonuclease H-like domain-containing protein [Tanacetum coccineum]